MTFTHTKQLKLGELDTLKRSTYAHIQLKDGYHAPDKCDKKMTVDPGGWHNYEYFYGDGKQKSWLINRGHLIGYRFSGLNDVVKNLVP